MSPMLRRYIIFDARILQFTWGRHDCHQDNIMTDILCDAYLSGGLCAGHRAVKWSASGGRRDQAAPCCAAPLPVPCSPHRRAAQHCPGNTCTGWHVNMTSTFINTTLYCSTMLLH